MANTPRPLETNGLVFASTDDGHLLGSEVRVHVKGLRREVAELRTCVKHVTSLERLAQATVMKADELAAGIEEARRRVDAMMDACASELGERRRRFEIDAGAQQVAARARSVVEALRRLQVGVEGMLHLSHLGGQVGEGHHALDKLLAVVVAREQHADARRASLYGV